MPEIDGLIEEILIQKPDIDKKKIRDLIEEKKNETVNVDKLALIVTPGTREHVEGLLQKLAAASGVVSEADTRSE